MTESNGNIDGLSAERTARLMRAVDLSGDILEAARGGDWEEVARLERRREDLLREFFAEPVPSQAESRVAEQLREIAALNDAAVALLSDARDSLGADLDNLRTGRRATRAYGENSG